MDDTPTLARGPRGRYAKSAEVQERILEAATDAFASAGYHAVTLKQIAATAGVSERGLVYHFPSKEELLIAVLDRHEQGVAQAFLHEGGAVSLGSFLRRVASDSLRPGLVELHCLLAAETIAPDHPAHERYRERYRGLREYLSATFRQLADRDGLRTSMSSEALASGFVALLDGLQLQWIHDKSTDVLATVQGYLAGVLADEIMSEIREHLAEVGAIGLTQQAVPTA